MDILLVTKYDTSGRLPTWDFACKAGLLTTISGEAEIAQRSVVAAFIQKGTIPQEPTVGNTWAELLVGGTSAVETDSLARANIKNYAGTFLYVPRYSVEKNKLTVTVTKESSNG